MEEIKKLFIIAGEASGDLHAASLVSNILQINPRIKIIGVGGELLAAAGCSLVSDIKDLAVMGFFDVIKKLPKFMALKELILEKIKTERPSAIILVDFSGFNLRLARAINKSIPVIYYISPQVWASRAGRLQVIRKYVSKMIVLFPFEKEFYRRHGINVECVGHPLLDTVKATAPKHEFLSRFGFSDKKLTIALLPGSRRSEIKNCLPVMRDTAILIDRTLGGVQFLIAKSTQVSLDLYDQLMRGAGIQHKIVEGKTYDCLGAADFALVCSGTATLETAILKKPFIIVYAMNLFNYLLYRPQVRLPYIGMVNIVVGKKIIPEFIQFGARPKRIAKKALEIIEDPLQLLQIQNNLSQIKSCLGEPGASARAARIILEFLAK